MTPDDKKLTAIVNTTIREAYYESCGNLRELKKISVILKDERMEREIDIARDALDHLHKHLEENYKWD